MLFLRVLGSAVFFFLAFGMIFADGGLVRAQTTVEILATDLVDDEDSVANSKKAYEKVNAKIAAAGVTGGTVVMFPRGEFKDVGEILVVDKDGTAGTAATATDAAVLPKPITLRGNGTVFTGKIVINVQESTYITIEGFTFKDVQVPDFFTHNYKHKTDSNVMQAISEAPHEVWEYQSMGTVWLNTGIQLAAGSTDSDCPSDGPINNVTIRNNEFRNTPVHGINVAAGPSGHVGNNGGYYARCKNTSAIEISGNVFIGIGLGSNADYLDADKTLPGNRNSKSAIQSGKAYGWTVRGNYVGAERDGTLATGTTWLGIKIDNAFGKTLIENNVVNGTASSGIVVGGDGSTGDNAADDAEITIRNNRVTNSRNDAYFTHLWADSFSSASTGRVPTNGYIGPWTPGAGMLTSSTYGPGLTDKQADELLKPRIHRLPSGFTRPNLPDSGSRSRAVSTVVTYDADGARTNTGDAHPLDTPGTTGGSPTNVPELSTIRNLKPGLEAGLELNRLTAKSIVVENNELTDNVVGLVVCPSWYCYADHPFQTILPASQTPAADTLKVPTLTANRIYDNRKRTDMPNQFVIADVVNALTETNTGAGKNVLILAGNYLGASPEVEGAVNTDDLLAMDDPDVGPKETDAPELPSTGGAMFTGTTVTLTYGEALDGESVPAAAAFTVTQTDSDDLSAEITVSNVEIDGMSVILTLAKAPGSGNSVTVSYDPTKAGSGTGVGPIQDAAGNAAAAIDSRMVAAAAPVEPEEPMTEEPMTGGGTAATGGDGGCALASGGSGIDLGMLLLTVVPFAFVLIRRAKEAV